MKTLIAFIPVLGIPMTIYFQTKKGWDIVDDYERPFHFWTSAIFQALSCAAAILVPIFF